MTTAPMADLTGLRVLVVEDQMVVAMEIEDILQTIGCVVVGPVGTIAGALRLAKKGALDAAILDVNLGGEKVFPVADVLLTQGVPFAFATGYGESSLPAEWRGRLGITKPFTRSDVEGAVRSICGR